MKQTEYIQYDGVELAALVRAKEVSAQELVQASIAQQTKVNGPLNAIVHHRHEQALEEAKSIQGQSPLSGVPFVLKDISQSIKGARLTSGSTLFKEHIATEEANYTRTLRKAGFVFTGFTNTPEFALKNITEPRLHGPTRNPWCHTRSSGGSSGGAASAVASGIVPIAGASDGGGSIRIPASFTGLVGLKPSRGKTPVGPSVGRNWQGAAIDFVLTRTVRDAAASLDILQTIQPDAAFQSPLYEQGYLHTLRREPTKTMKFAYTLTSPVGTPVSETAKEAVRQAVQFIEKEGHIAEEVEWPIDGEALMRHYYAMNCGEMSHLFHQLERQAGHAITLDHVEIESWMLAEAGKFITAREYVESLHAWDDAARHMSRLHDTYTYFMTPTTADTAPRIGELTLDASRIAELQEDMLRAETNDKRQDAIYEMFLPSLTYTPFTQLANLTGQPAISLPVASDEEGMPIGIQLMAMKGNDHLLLRAASYVEQTDLWKGFRNNPYFQHD
ncbi:amidase [Savagea sp. SN6]|uniref:Amidase n=1 Tax=Savagea serpentis TaxID=2785297 RepID=A0A8J7G7E7_9BACL|nr:amidase family protein [Savagea serpentis]MBF4500553.1 amidase [Savagea serpentis]